VSHGEPVGRFAFMAEGKKSFILYCDQRGIFDKLPDEYAGRLIKHIFAYVNDEDPETDDLVITMAFEGIKTALKRDLEKYRQYIEKQRVNGKSGGRPKKANESQKTQAFLEKPKKADSDSVSDSDSVNENEKKKRTTFVAPVINEVELYCAERGMKKEFAAVFVDGMSSKGWKVGKEICKDWKAAFRTWAAKEWNQQYRINQLKNNPRVITADTEL
jgi:hypothetical protein